MLYKIRRSDGKNVRMLYRDQTLGLYTHTVYYIYIYVYIHINIWLHEHENAFLYKMYINYYIILYDSLLQLIIIQDGIFKIFLVLIKITV